MVTTTSVKHRGTFLLEGRGIMLFLAFLVTLICLIFFGSRSYHFTHYSVSPGSPLIITAAPGQKIFLVLNAGTSLNGLWSSPQGLAITLNSPANFSTQVVAPQEPGWSELIGTGNSAGEPIVIDGSFLVPTPDNPSASTVTGQIIGNVVYPDPDDFGSYHDQPVNISIPVTILLVSPSVVFADEQLPLYLSSGAGILLLLLIPAVCRTYDIQRKRAVFL
ncbi:MAG TPA: hypothetical protein VGM01_06470 [Ktedonobacteraceae bacterium]